MDLNENINEIKGHSFSDELVDALIASLTLEEKIALCSGKDEWVTKEIKAPSGATRIPSARVADGPHGLRKTIGQGDNMGLAGSEPATCFPAECLLACSYDRGMAARMGSAIADEARAAGVCTVLGPGVNIKRNPLCGRNFEYLSEDPFLAGRMAAAYIGGVQGRGIGTSLKHFACNSQEYFRMISDSRVDDRTLREIYLSAFEYAIKTAAPATVMCAYNKLNGTHCSDNEFLLDTVLRGEWGYQGLVVSDWGALNNRVNAFRAGCDLIMPGGSAYEEKDVKKAVLSGELSEEPVDRSAKRVAAFALRQSAKMKDVAGEYAEEQLSIAELHARNHGISQMIAENSAVLLKNDGDVLPLTAERSIGLIGMMAERFRFQGSGSSKINPTRKESLWTCMQGTFGAEQELLYARGYDAKGETDEDLIREAVEVAKRSEQVVLVAGLTEQYEAEGMDRRSMALPAGEDRLIDEVTKVNSNVIVVLISGCVVETPWADRVQGILWMGLSGQAGAAALVRILSGEVNPSGKLAESWPMVYSDCPSSAYYLQEGRDADYREGWQVGYRYYDRAGVPVRFPFGHGLSYTTFSYSDIEGRQENGKTYVTVKVTNTGNRAGKEAVLLYIRASQKGIDRPERELKGFEKIELAAGETRQVEFEIDTRTFAVWHEGWKVYEGVYRIEIGDQKKKIFIRGEKYDAEAERLKMQKALEDEERAKKEAEEKERLRITALAEAVAAVNAAEAEMKEDKQEKLKDRKKKHAANDLINFVVEMNSNKSVLAEKKKEDPPALPMGMSAELEKRSAKEKVEKYTVNSTIAELSEDIALLRLAYRIFEKQQAKMNGRESADYLAAMSAADECPIRALQMFAKLKNHFAQAMADFGNKHFIKGVKKLFT